MFTDRESSEPNTLNDFLLGSNGTQLGPVLPMVITTKQQAFRTAAWLKIMGEILPDEETASTFEEIEEAIKRT